MLNDRKALHREEGDAFYANFLRKHPLRIPEILERDQSDRVENPPIQVFMISDRVENPPIQVH